MISAKSTRPMPLCVKAVELTANFSFFSALDPQWWSLLYFHNPETHMQLYNSIRSVHVPLLISD